MKAELGTIDFELLHKQKLELLRRVPDGHLLMGVVHLIDRIQDDAVEQGLWKFPAEVEP